MGRLCLDGRTALVTGASTGIGRAISECLAASGMRVLACARKETDLNALNALPGIRGLRLDVTSRAEIEDLAESLPAEGTRIFALINNAGIAVGGPVLLLPEGELRECLEVNTIGPVNVVRALFPLMEEGGCIVNMSSMGARYVTPWMAPYHMAKSALEAYSEALRMEVAPFGVRVAIVEPGAVRTEAFDKWDRLLRQMRGTVYERAFERYWAMITAQHEHALDPGRIAEVVRRILQDPKPRLRTLVPHRPIVRAIILLASLGWSERVYGRFLREVDRVPPGYFAGRGVGTEDQRRPDRDHDQARPAGA
jgi:NAD(P)-dependent dehydrogenase (short-subunit alcohol dehydrogenase family)